jgi:hypothetical protein
MGYKYHLSSGYTVGNFPESFEKTLQSAIHEIISQRENNATILYVKPSDEPKQLEYNKEHPCVVAHLTIDWKALR